MRLSYNNTLNNLCEPYINNLLERFNTIDPGSLPDDVYRVLQCLIENIDRDSVSSSWDAAHKALEEYAENHHIKDIADLFEGELQKVLIFLLGEEWTEIFTTYCKLEAEYPFATGAYRRAMRDRAVKPHIRHIIFAIGNFILLKASGYSPCEWLKMSEDYRYESLSFEDLFAVLIFKENPEAIDYFKDILSNPSNTKEITFSHLRAIVKGGNPELSELETKLLLNTHLQEGLRQAIMETADEGMPDSFLYILKAIKNNGLERFASIKRAFGAWTGLGDAAAKEHIAKREIELMYLFLTDLSNAKKQLFSDDSLTLYLVLWSIGFYNLPDVVEPIERIIEEGRPHQIQTVLIFLNNVENSTLQASIAAKVLRKYSDDHRILAGALPMYLANFFWKTPEQEKEMEEKFPDKPIYDLDFYLGDKTNGEKDFEILSNLYRQLGKKEVFDPYVFPWEMKELSKAKIAGKISNLAMVLHSPEWTDKALEFIPGVNPEYRDAVILRLLTYPTSRKQIDFLIENMGAGTVDSRNVTCKIVERLFEEGKLNADDFRKMENLLRLKASETRISIIKIFSGLEDEDAYESVSRLLKDKNNMKRLAGLEIVKQWNEKKTRRDLIEKLLPSIREINKPDAQEKKMISVIIGTGKKKSRKEPEKPEIFSRDNGFGLYDATVMPKIEVSWPSDFNADDAFTFKNPDEGVQLMKKLMSLIDKNADLEFETSWGETMRLGHSVVTTYSERDSRRMNVAYPELWIEFYNEEIKNTGNLWRLAMPFLIGEIDKCFEPQIKQFFGKVYGRDPYKSLNDKKYFDSAKAIVKQLFYHLNDKNTWKTIVDLFSDIAARIQPDDIIKKISYHSEYIDPHLWPLWLEDPYIHLAKIIPSKNPFDEDLFRKYFAAGYSLYHKSAFMGKKHVDIRMPLWPEDFQRAWETGMFSDQDFLREMLGMPYSHFLVRYFTDHLPGVRNPEKFKGYDESFEELPVDLTILVEKAVARIMEIELQRGSTPTDVSHLAIEIECVKGVDNFIGILVALGKDKLTKSSYNEEKSKKEVMSHLLSVCVPTDMDSAAYLKEKAVEANISEQRLVEAALYSPRWLELVEEALGWQGLKSGAYYFLAHTGDRLDDIEKLKIAKYSKIEPQDFEDGAFDPVWFHEVYAQLGEKRFNMLYEAAKYVSEGNRHIRSRKLSDAVLGKFSKQQLMTEISAKRNKDLVVALGLVPLEGEREKDVEERYLFLQNFLKEGKQFGIQRRTSEARSVKLSLDNLARTAGYSDSTRLTWNIETKLIESLSDFLTPRDIEGVNFHIEISEGMPEIIIDNKGRKLGSVPAKFKKNEYIIQLKEAFNNLKDQHARGRALLENSMCELTEFSGSEIMELRKNPVIGPMLGKLALINEIGVIGFPTELGNALITIEGHEIEILPEDRLRIAHAYDLFKSGNWSKFQKLLFSKEWKQPFKQIFRELYIATPEEREQTKSMRYSGHQLLPSKTASILKKRNWVLDYENGLQKVLTERRLAAVLFAMADWFTPADIEPPTLEYVSFYDTSTGEEKPISEIEPIIFSEIMRDVDLVVSVANVGLTDPEASNSTIDMRRAIIENIISMFRLSNAQISDRYVKIKGRLGEYDIHLGSGIIHQVGGSEIAVIPVHSQSRGRIFMPFIDDDPKTAEIITKVLMFSEDNKIKDPSILSQINRESE